MVSRVGVIHAEHVRFPGDEFAMKLGDEDEREVGGGSKIDSPIPLKL